MFPHFPFLSFFKNCNSLIFKQNHFYDIARNAETVSHDDVTAEDVCDVVM